MECHLLHYTEEKKTIETNEILHIPKIKEEEIEINTEINEKSNESLCLNDNENSIPFCNILLSKFLDLTPENELTPIENTVDTRTATEKCESNVAAQRLSTKRKEKNDLHNHNEQTKLLDSYKEMERIKKNNMQNLNEEVNIEAAIMRRKTKTEKQRLYRERKRLEKNELSVANKRKSTAEASKRYRERQKVKEVDIEVEINKRKKNAERYKRYREMQKIRKNYLQDEIDIEIENERRKRKAERQKRYMERKKLENDELYWANQRKRMAEAMRRYRLKKKKGNEFQDGNEQVDIQVVTVNKRKKTCKVDESCTF